MLTHRSIISSNNFRNSLIMTRFNLAARMGLVALTMAACSAAEASSITEWNFGSVAAVSPDNTPAATTGTGTATSLGMTNSYTYTTNGASTGVGAVTLDDVTNDSPVPATSAC